MLMGLTLVDLFGFGLGLNPAIDPGDDHPEAPVVAYLRREVGLDGRVLGVGEELPPNVADAVRAGRRPQLRLGRAVAEPGLVRAAVRARPRAAIEPARPITWAGVLRARDRLREASVRGGRRLGPAAAEGLCPGRSRGGGLGRPARRSPPGPRPRRGPARLDVRRDHGRVRIAVLCPGDDRIIIRETFDPGWRAEVDGRAVTVEPAHRVFLSVPVTAGTHCLKLALRPARSPRRAGRHGPRAGLPGFCLDGISPIPIYSIYRSRAWTDPSPPS